MDFAFILDPLPELKAYKDSSIAMMRELARRGHRVHALGQADLYWDAGVTRGRARPLELFADNHAWYREGPAESRALKHFAAVIMRKDPPFDMEYVYSTYLLECAEREGARVFNRPRAIRDHNEKMAIAKFGEFIAPTLVTRDAERIGQFIDEHADVIVKPLDGMGGSSIFRVGESDPNRNVIVETVSHHGRRTVMVQKYLPEIVDGDKRVLVIAGEVVPYALARIPKPGETRGNLAAGGRGEARPLHRPRVGDRACAGPRAVGGRIADRRPRRDRPLPHRSERDVADVLRRDHRAGRLRRARPLRRCAAACRAALARPLPFTAPRRPMRRVLPDHDESPPL